MPETALTPPESTLDLRAELSREQDRLAKLWQAYKSQEDELEQLRRERPIVMDTVATQDRTLAELRREVARLQESGNFKEKFEETARQNRILLIEVENLNRELRNANQILHDREGELAGLREAGASKEHVERLEKDLQAERERLAKLFKVYEEQQADLATAKDRLDRWESWFSRMEPAVTSIAKSFADSPRA
jgi:chromosome segregation ATPase